MRIVYIGSSISRNAGGIFEIEKNLALHLKFRDQKIKVFGLTDEFTDTDRSEWENVSVTSCSAFPPRNYGFSFDLIKNVANERIDILHLHNLWMFPSFVTGWVSKTKACKSVVTINGMLDEWAYNNSKYKKRLLYYLHEKWFLKQVSCIHCNTLHEMESVRRLGFKNPICLIPNGVTQPSINRRYNENKKILLYLGRLHPKKGLSLALKSWSLLKTQNPKSEMWEFVICGWDQVGYKAELMKICDTAGLKYRSVSIAEFFESKNDGFSVTFLDPVYGTEKEKIFRKANSFILPSFSEGLPMAVLEAWSFSLPVLMTSNCNLDIGFKSLAALKMETEIDSVLSVLNNLVNMTDEALESYGRNGRELVMVKFSWPNVVDNILSVYEWLHGNGEKPECVHEHY